MFAVDATVLADQVRFLRSIVGQRGSTASCLFHAQSLGIVTAGTCAASQPPLPFRFLPYVLRLTARVNGARG